MLDIGPQTPLISKKKPSIQPGFLELPLKTFTDGALTPQLLTVPTPVKLKPMAPSSTRNAATFKKSPAFSPLPRHSRVSMVVNGFPKEHKSPVPSVTGFNFAEYMIYFPDEEDLEQAKQTQSARANFVSFRSIVTGGPSAALTEGDSKELFSPFNTERVLKRQLQFNKKQENLFRKTSNEHFLNTQTKLKLLKHEREVKIKKMPKIKIQPSVRFSNQRNTFEDDAKEDDEKNKIKYPKYIKFIKFGPNDHYNFHWSFVAEDDRLAWKPVVREGASLVIIGKFGYLYGGRSKDISNEVAILDTMKWKWIYQPISKEYPPHGRSGHTANVYKKTMVVFGGVKNFNPTLNIRECLNDVRFYIPETNEWTYLKCVGDLVEPRRHHTSVIVGKHLVIHGGINSTGEYLDDIKALDLVSTRWIDCQQVDKEALGVAFHKSCLVLYEQRKEVNLLRMTDFKPDDKAPVIKEEGIYFFGGRHPDDGVSNTLKILKIGQTPFKWITPETIGKPPEARYLHSMVHCKSLNMLVVYGGRNDNMFSKGELTVLGDFYTLQLETLTWVAVTLHGMQGAPRFSHVASVVGTSMIIFGGINFDVYSTGDMNLIEMDQMIVNKLALTSDKERSSPGGLSDLASGFGRYKSLDRGNTIDVRRYTGILSYLPVPNRQLNQQQAISLDPLRNNKNYPILSARTSKDRNHFNIETFH